MRPFSGARRRTKGLCHPNEFVGNPQALQVTLKLNGQTMQDECTADMIFSVARLIEFISMHVQLLPGDLGPRLKATPVPH